MAITIGGNTHKMLQENYGKPEQLIEHLLSQIHNNAYSINNFIEIAELSEKWTFIFTDPSDNKISAGPLDKDYADAVRAMIAKE